jgi:hypothetical protein
MTGDTEKFLLRYLLRYSAQLWKWYPVRKAKKYAEAQKTGKLTCEQCGFTKKLNAKGARELFEVDHRVPVGQRPYSLRDFEWYLNRRFCGPENLQLLCKHKCHKAKTQAENKARVEARRKLKENKKCQS